MFVYTYCTMFKEPVIKKKRENSRARNREAKSSFRNENSGVDMNSRAIEFPRFQTQCSKENS